MTKLILFLHKSFQVVLIIQNGWYCWPSCTLLFLWYEMGCHVCFEVITMERFSCGATKLIILMYVKHCFQFHTTVYNDLSSLTTFKNGDIEWQKINKYVMLIRIITKSRCSLIWHRNIASSRSGGNNHSFIYNYTYWVRFCILQEIVCYVQHKSCYTVVGRQFCITSYGDA